MSDQAKPKTELVIDPRANDFDSARAVLDDLYEVMKKHNCLLAVKEIVVGGVTLHPLFLARVEGEGKARVIAELRQITPEMIESRRLMWNGKIIRDPMVT